MYTLSPRFVNSSCRTARITKGEALLARVAGETSCTIRDKGSVTAFHKPFHCTFVLECANVLYLRGRWRSRADASPTRTSPPDRERHARFLPRRRRRHPSPRRRCGIAERRRHPDRDAPRPESDHTRSMVDSGHGAGGRRSSLCEGPGLGCHDLDQGAERPTGEIGERQIEDHRQHAGRRRAIAGRAHQAPKTTRALARDQGPKAPGEEGRSEAEKEIMNEIILAPAAELQPAPLFTPTPKAAQRVLEFFTAQINNDHTRKAYLNANTPFSRLVRLARHRPARRREALPCRRFREGAAGRACAAIGQAAPRSAAHAL